MALLLRQELINALARDAYGGFEGLADAWYMKNLESPDFPPAKNRASLYRWAREGVPVTGVQATNQLFAFCALLDVDPLAVLDYEKIGYFKRFAFLRHKVQLGLASLVGLAPIVEMYGPSAHWPSDDIAMRCYGRCWRRHEFVNESQWHSNDYALIRLRFAMPVLRRPRAALIAYRRLDSPDTMWRVYGWVVGVEGRLALYDEAGRHQSMNGDDPDEMQFRTYFGGRLVEFRVASLHDFESTIEFPFNDKSGIGFEW